MVVITHQYRTEDGVLVGRKDLAISKKGTVNEGSVNCDDIIVPTYYIPMAVLHAKCTFPDLLAAYRFVPVRVYNRLNVFLTRTAREHPFDRYS